MTESHALPFEPKIESIKQWQSSIDRLTHSEKASELNGVLNKLETAPIEKEALLEIANELTESILLVSKLLERSVISSQSAQGKSRKSMSVALQLPQKLGFLFAQLAQQEALPETQRVYCIYRGLQILTVVCQRTTLFYEAPDLALWKKIAGLYLLAEARQWLTTTVEDCLPGLIRQPTIEDLVKHVLLFYGCLPYQYAESDIAAIFSMTAELSGMVRLESTASDFAMVYWSPDSFLPPQCSNTYLSEEPVFSIDASKLVDFLERNPEESKKLKKVPGMLDRLTAYHDIRCSVDPGKPNRCGLIIGNTQVSKFLNLLISRYRVLELTESLQRHLLMKYKWELVPLEIRNTLASLSSKILADVNNISSRQLTIFETDKYAYCTAKIANAECAVDEPAILVIEDQPPCFAVIRHSRSDSNPKFRNILIERIDGEVYPLEIEENQAFIIRRPASVKTELFLSPNHRLSPHAVLRKIKGIIDDPIKVEKLLEYNAHFARYQVSLL